MSRASGSECSEDFKDDPFAVRRSGDPPSAKEGGEIIRMKKRRKKKEMVYRGKCMEIEPACRSLRWHIGLGVLPQGVPNSSKRKTLSTS
jgi:hypothetical protein